MKETIVHSTLRARGVKPLAMSAQDCKSYQDLRNIGINLSDTTVRQMMSMDASLASTMTGGSIGTPIQFLQAWLPGFVQVMTTPRKIDELIGIATIGDWADEEIVQGVMEPTGQAALYGDYTNVPLASWNAQYERRTIVRFEQGFSVGKLEEARSGRMNVNTAAEKRNAASLMLEIQRNRIGFYGYNSGENRTYGFLNDPSLPAYINVAQGAAKKTEWANKTFLEITADIRGWVNQLLVQSASTINAIDMQTTLALPISAITYLSVTSDFGNSVQDWLSKTYPKMRVVTAPELDKANGGQNAVYLYAESVADGSSDGGAVFMQAVPTKYIALGVENRAKDYLEDFGNATAGVLCKRPLAVVRASGV